jgi:DNA-binding CsgD family transcriptional regulator
MSPFRHAEKRTVARPTAGQPEEAPAQPRTSVESLVRQLTAQAKICSEADSCRADSPQSQVLIDTEVDGVRCVLLRQKHREMSRISLSPREREIARMVAIGHPNKAIAAVLEISSWTVCTHLRRIFAKLGVSSRAAMVARTMGEPNWSDDTENEGAKGSVECLVSSHLRPSSRL